MSDMVRLDYVLVCDDVRLEIGHKPSAMGIFTDGVSVPGFPFVFAKLSFLVHALLLTPTETIKIGATFRYKDQPLVVLAKDQEVKIRKTPKTPSGMVLTFQVAPLLLESAGDAVLTITIGSKQFRKKFSVETGPAPKFMD
jgi:hypothetical protein